MDEGESHTESLLFVKTYDEFLHRLREHEVSTHSKFILRNSCKRFSVEKWANDDKEPTIRWQNNLPYIYIGMKMYACHQGKDWNVYQKKKYEAKRDSNAKRYKKSKPSKKVGCPATIQVTRVVRFTEFMISEPSSKYKKYFIAKKIKRQLRENIFGEEGYYFNLPMEKDHQNHAIGPVANVKQSSKRTKNHQTEHCITDVIVIQIDHQYHLISPEENVFEETVFEENEEVEDQLAEFPSSSKKQQLINNCLEMMQSIESCLWDLNEKNLGELNTALRDILDDVSSKMETDNPP